jgi:tRNA dimethylallyltransferase
VLYGHVPAAEAYSVGRFAADAGRAIAEARAAGRIPIVVGGTGLYFKTLTEGLSPIPAIPDAIRVRWRAEALRIGAAGLHKILAARDSEMAARLEPTDPQRIVRALEVLEATGRSLADWQRIPGVPIVREADTVRLVVSPERDALYERIEARFDAMMEAGALDEVAALSKLGLDPALPAMRALGVRPLMQLLAGETEHEEAVTSAKAETRQFAKRQLTWLRGNMSAWKWLQAQETESKSRDILAFIDW